MNNNLKRFLVFFIFLNLILNLAINSACAKNVEKSSIQKNVQIPSLGEYNQSKKLVAKEYILGANDTISIEFLGIPELSKELVVQPDGKISIPYLENFYVAGKTIPEVQIIIKKTYEEYLENPEINIKIVQTRPFIVYISGAILNPGSYELNTRTNQSPFFSKPEAFIERKTPLLSNVIVAAGGLTCEVDSENAIVKNDHNNSVTKVNLLKLIENADSSQDIYLMAGDRIHIPKLPSKNFIDEKKYKSLVSSTLFQKTIPVKVIGYVNNPGLVTLDSQQSANLTSAIAQAGGYPKNSAYIPTKVLISRSDSDNNEKLLTFKVDPREKEVLLMPNDIVYVPEKIRPKLGKFFDYISRTCAPFYMITRINNEW